jgi:hypothetical protein|tara:strand:+ start:393 stop:836 length:444 start_codon:yes stop_codon:yes gene_type:complete
MVYQHTQTGLLTRRLLRAISIITAGSGLFVALRSTLRSIPLLASSAIVFVCATLFDSLTVRVSHDLVEISFGIGIIRKQFDVGNIRRASVVKNKWYYGWGIRLTPHGWLYNVSGLDAVEILMDNGKQYRIGTDQPNELENAINTVIQ